MRTAPLRLPRDIKVLPMAETNPPAETPFEAGEAHARPASFWKLTIGCIGVVYGDIGTSPLYAFRESVLAAVGPHHAADAPAVLGILSLIIWALFLVVTAKYIAVLLRADNHGEGGTLALMALANKATGGHTTPIILLGIVSGALFYGDAMITPALSVLSAVEGLKIVAPAFTTYVVPLTALILIGLFAVQSHGTARVAAFFGPITLVWFAAIAAAGLWHVAGNWSVLRAFNPVYGISFLASHGIIGLATLGAVFLVVHATATIPEPRHGQTATFGSSDAAAAATSSSRTWTAWLLIDSAIDANPAQTKE